MRTAGSLFTLTLLFILAQSQADAATDINVQTTGDSASATVNVQNSFNSSSTTTNTVDSHTKVRIETNGEVKEYETTGNEDIHVESKDGNSTVTITNQGNTTQKPSISPETEREEIEKEIDDAKRKMEEKMEELETEQKNFIEKIIDSISSFFGNLF